MSSRMISLLLLMILSAGGCAENRASFYIQDMKVPTEECVIPGDKEATYYSWGTWDLGLRSNYQVHPLVVNALSDSKNLNPIDSPTSLIQVEGAWVSVLNEGDVQLTEEKFVYSPCTVSHEEGSTAMNFTAVEVSTYDSIGGIDTGEVAALPTRNELCGNRSTGTIVIRIRVVGVTSGGKDVETPYFYFPITVCCGCLVYFPPEAFDPILDMHVCLDEEGTSGETEAPCFPGQDKDIDCRVCAGNNPVMCAPTHTSFLNPWYL